MRDTCLFIRELAVSAGKIMLEYDGSSCRFDFKTSNKDVVTEFDVKVQEHIMEQIRKEYPGASFFAEESSCKGELTADDLFVIDPIDGTSNFLHGANYSAVSIAYYRSGEPVCGVVYDPFNGEMFHASAGEGAYLNDKPIRTPDASMSGSLIVFGTSPYDQDTTDRTFEIIKSVYGRCQDIRRLGSAALDICHVAEGRYGLYFESALSFWDYAAAAIVLREAGGKFVDYEGNDISASVSKTSVIAGSEAIINESGLIRR